jgi:predicted  nucleic acid-binding Zn-ribbon protein
MKKEQINTALLTIITIVVSAIGGFILQMDSKINQMKESQIKNQMMIEAHNQEAEIWIERIKNLENKLTY